MFMVFIHARISIHFNHYNLLNEEESIVQIWYASSLSTPKESSVPSGDNVNFDKLCKLKKWSNGAKILVCGRRPSHLSNKTILNQNKFIVSELRGF